MFYIKSPGVTGLVTRFRAQHDWAAVGDVGLFWYRYPDGRRAIFGDCIGVRRLLADTITDALAHRRNTRVDARTYAVDNTG